MEKRIFENFVSTLVHFLHFIIFLNVVLSVNVVFGHHFGKKKSQNKLSLLKKYLCQLMNNIAIENSKLNEI